MCVLLADDGIIRLDTMSVVIIIDSMNPELPINNPTSSLDSTSAVKLKIGIIISMLWMYMLRLLHETSAFAACGGGYRRARSLLHRQMIQHRQLYRNSHNHRIESTTLDSNISNMDSMMIDQSNCLASILTMNIATTQKLVIRPTLDDIERISRGQAAKRRGTGSRQIPHRLNEMERREWELAKVRRFVMLRGTGYRKERGDSPLANIYRNYCDAVAIPCITIIRSLGIDAIDQVVIDFSPVRTTNGLLTIVQECRQHAECFESCVNIEEYSDVSKLFVSLSTQTSSTELPNDNTIVFADQPIWNIPMFGLVASFNKRADGRQYAQSLAITLAQGKQTKKRKTNDNDESTNLDEADDVL